MEECGGLQSMGSPRVGRDGETHSLIHSIGMVEVRLAPSTGPALQLKYILTFFLISFLFIIF